MQQRPGKPGIKGQSVRDQGHERHGPEIDAELQAHIGRHLKITYDDILNQEVPDRFLELLKQLESKTEPGAPKGKR